MMATRLWRIRRCPQAGAQTAETGQRPASRRSEHRFPGSGLGSVVLVVAAVAVGLGVLPGCVRRTLTINTQPQGATVILNDEVVGTSPVSTDFLWYGDYDVIIRKPGYETLRTHHRLNAPWYQLPGLDFVTEALMPFEFHDRQEMAFSLEPEKPIDRARLVQDARRMRDEALYGSDEPTTSTKPAP